MWGSYYFLWIVVTHVFLLLSNVFLLIYEIIPNSLQSVYYISYLSSVLRIIDFNLYTFISMNIKYKPIIVWYLICIYLYHKMHVLVFRMSMQVLFTWQSMIQCCSIAITIQLCNSSLSWFITATTLNALINVTYR